MRCIFQTKCVCLPMFISNTVAIRYQSEPQDIHTDTKFKIIYFGLIRARYQLLSTSFSFTVFKMPQSDTK